MSKHAAHAHQITAKETYVQLVCDGVAPTCACGCGSPVKFHTINTGFSQYAWGHASRVHNNWGHNQTALANSAATIREMSARGELTGWTLGLTKETDARVAALGRKGSKTVLADPVRRQARSEHLKQRHAAGEIRYLAGSEHGNWRGGASSLAATCHGHAKLYWDWKFPKLQAANFRCTKCASSQKLEVHHDQERMCDIIRRFAVDAGYDGTEKTQRLKHVIAAAVADYHVSADVSGVVLCATCHDAAHR